MQAVEAVAELLSPRVFRKAPSSSSFRLFSFRRFSLVPDSVVPAIFLDSRFRGTLAPRRVVVIVAGKQSNKLATPGAHAHTFLGANVQLCWPSAPQESDRQRQRAPGGLIEQL